MSGKVLLVHSGGLTSRQWRRLAQQLAPDHEVVMPDLIGYGAAPRWAVGSPFDFRRDVERLAELVGDTPTHLVGHSYGGLLVLQLALLRPQSVRSIAAYEPVTFGILGDDPDDVEARAEIARLPHYVPDAHGVDEAWLAGFVEWWQGAGTWARLAPETQQGFRDVGWKLSQEVASLSADQTDRATYATITAPTLLLGGSATQPVELHVLRRLAAALPNATLTVFPDLGHMGPLTHGTLVNAAIAAHLTAAS